MKIDILKSRPATTVFALVALLGGFAFLNQSFTGNAVLNGSASTEIIPIIGLCLIACAFVLGIYSLRKRK